MATRLDDHRRTLEEGIGKPGAENRPGFERDGDQNL